MRTWVDVVKNALAVYAERDKFAYFMGAKGEKLTDERMETLWNAYYNEHFHKYTDEQKKQIFDYSRGKIGYDCSGFVGGLVSDASGSWGQIENCIATSEDVISCAPGCILWFPGHVGISVGYGYCLHFPTEGATCTLSRVDAVGWTKYGYHKNINYLGAVIGAWNR